MRVFELRLEIGKGLAERKASFFLFKLLCVDVEPEGNVQPTDACNLIGLHTTTFLPPFSPSFFFFVSFPFFCFCSSPTFKW